MAATTKKFFDYVKVAFKNQWNLLVVGAATLFGMISGHPDVALPVIAAGEMAYLVTTAGHPRFQNYVDNYLGKIGTGGTVQKRFEELYTGLDDAAREEWNDLRARCDALGEPGAGHLDAIAEEQLAGVNKLLWVHLKLLHTKARLERFFASTDEREIERSYLDASRRLAALPAAGAAGADPIAEKKRNSLEDTLATLTARKENVRRARDNYEFVNLELGRIAAKLKGVVELAANRQDPAALTTEVDDAARSVQSTEQMIGELQSFTGLTSEDVEAPKILSLGQRAAAARAVKTG